MNAQADVLARCDGLAETFEFPGFNNMNYESADARMHLFRGEAGWALLIEEAVDWQGAGRATTILFRATSEDGGLIDDYESQLDAPIDDDGLEYAKLRGEVIDLGAVNARAAELEVEPSFALLVLLSETRRDDLFRRPDELTEHVPAGLTHVLTITDWCHPDVYGGPKPSESEVFVQVAEVLATGNVAAFAPTEAPNNRDWRMWQASR